ncbi:MAG: putative RNase H-like HicB family nuclease [Verrucomicrobiales bacterium]|jgi:predicted RNase H-like HicB family nuclease
MTKSLELTATVEQDGDWFIAFSPEVPEGNGQGRTQDEALQSLWDSIELLVEDRREDARKATSDGLLLPLEAA